MSFSFVYSLGVASELLTSIVHSVVSSVIYENPTSVGYSRWAIRDWRVGSNLSGVKLFFPPKNTHRGEFSSIKKAEKSWLEGGLWSTLFFRKSPFSYISTISHSIPYVQWEECSARAAQMTTTMSRGHRVTWPWLSWLPNHSWHKLLEDWPQNP